MVRDCMTHAAQLSEAEVLFVALSFCLWVGRQGVDWLCMTHVRPRALTSRQNRDRPGKPAGRERVLYSQPTTSFATPEP